MPDALVEAREIKGGVKVGQRPTYAPYKEPMRGPLNTHSRCSRVSIPTHLTQIVQKVFYCVLFSSKSVLYNHSHSFDDLLEELSVLMSVFYLSLFFYTHHLLILIAF